MSNLTTYEQAKRLEKLGFNFEEKCFCGGAMDCICDFVSDEHKLIPVSEAIDYLREEKRVLCSVLLVITMNGDFIGYKGAFMDGKDAKYTESNPTHPLVESALLTAVLDYLEKGG